MFVVFFLVLFNAVLVYSNDPGCKRYSWIFGYYCNSGCYLGSDNQCYLCSNSLDNCESCYWNDYDKASCGTCSNGYYRYLSDHHYICKECSDSLDNCENCYWNDYDKASCGTCSNGYYRYLSDHHYICKECSYFLDGCESCYRNGYDKMSCGTCSDGYYRYETDVNYICKKIGLSVDNPFLCKTLVVFDDVRFVGLIMELGEFGSLSSVLKRTKVLQKHIAVSVIAQIIIALDYLHENKIVYRDLKTDNIVITRGGWIKLIDFGYAAHCRNKRNTVCGTIQYLAPELILGKPYDMKIDVWSLGILSFELFFGYSYFKQTESYATMWNILNKDIEIPLQNQTIIAFLNKTLIRNPRKRCSVHDLYFDDLFIGINWEKYKKEKGFNPCVVFTKEQKDITKSWSSGRRLNWKECLKDADESVLAIVNPILHDM
ncbi:Aurora kinase [Entamoeba marina]